MMQSGEVLYLLRDSTWISHHFHLYGIQLQHMNRLKKGKSKSESVGSTTKTSFCTLNICFRRSGEQPNLAIIFRRKGLRLSAVEKASWDKDVGFFFQPKPWTVTESVVNWAEKTLKPAVADVSRFILFLDNLEVHTHESFQKSISNRKGITWFGVPGATDI